MRRCPSERKMSASHKHGAQGSSSRTEDEEEAAEPVDAAAPTPVADAHDAAAGGEGKKEPARVGHDPQEEHRPC